MTTLFSCVTITSILKTVMTENSNLVFDLQRAFGGWKKAAKSDEITLLSFRPNGFFPVGSHGIRPLQRVELFDSLRFCL